MLRWFENRIDPFPPAAPAQPPTTLFAFCMHYVRGSGRWLLLMAAFTAAIAIAEVVLYAYVGSLVDRLAAHTPDSFLQAEGGRLFAVSANAERAAAFGIAPERILPMWDWVGGRYSLWSAVGFPVALAIGMAGFERLLAGAAAMDAHAIETPLERNLAAWHALAAVWNRNALGAATQAVLPYDERLKLLPNYLQQLAMESLGKSVRADGGALEADTVPVWWGGAGTDAQHSYFQALHQGTQLVPADFVGVVRGEHAHADNHAALLANLLAQSEALANGQPNSDPHRVHAGGRPSTLLLLDALTPESLGMLIALYEHSVYLQAVAWGVNAFDQFGVELGKQVANRLLPALRGEAEADDAVTQALLEEISRRS